MEILPRNTYDGVQRVKVIVTLVIETCILIFLATLGYFIRTGDRFPRRMTPFDPNEPSISYHREQGLKAMAGFDFKAQVSEVVVVVLSFCLPPAVILIGESMQCRKCNSENSMTVTGAFLVCHFFTPTRRIFRFIGTFLMGILTTMIFNDVTKFMIGRPRPIFLDICSVNQSACYDQNWSPTSSLIMCDPDSACTNKDVALVAWASKSFPSFHASLTSFASVFTAIYIHRTLSKILKLRILGPFLGLSFVMMSLLCCLERYALFFSHWTDVVVGFGWGAIMAIYLAVFNLYNFEDRDIHDLFGVDNDVDVFGGSHHHRQHLQRYKSAIWSEHRDKIPWYWAPWHWSNHEIQNSRLTLDRLDNKTTTTLATNYRNSNNISSNNINHINNNSNNNNNNHQQQQQQQIKFNNPLVVDLEPNNINNNNINNNNINNNNNNNAIITQRQKSRDNVTSLEDYY